MATDINVVSLTGRLTRDSELQQTNSGSSLLKFSIANNKGKKKDGDNWVEQEPNYFNIILWGRQGEVLQQYLTKGKQVAVNGRLQQRSYQAQDGAKRSIVQIVADNVLLCSGQTSGSYNNYPNQVSSENQSNPAPKADLSSNFDADPANKVDESSSNFGADPAKKVDDPSSNFGADPAKKVDEPSSNFGADPVKRVEEPSSNFGADPAKGVDDPFSSDAQSSTDDNDDIPF